MDCKTVVTEITTSYGEKPDGFQEYLKKCNRIDKFVRPNNVPDYCVGYEVPEGIILHQIMVQPYFQRNAIEAKKNDIVIASFPKAGTTWVQEICYTVCSKGDLSKANAVPLDSRMIFLEIPIGGLKAIENNKDDPRIFKTHLPYNLLPKNFLKLKTRTLYIARNPKDDFVSSYFFYKNLVYIAYTGTIKDFLEEFLNEKVMYSSFAHNVLSFWNRRHEENVFFITYEKLQKDTKGGIRQISDFIGQELNEEQLDAIVEHTSFEKMAKNPMTNYSTGAAVCVEGSTFHRKGKVGDWKNYFDEEMNRKMDDYIKKHFEGTGLEFEYEI